jgi:hypothetical protein
MEKIVAWERRIVTARIADAVVNRVVPIIIVIGVLPVPAAIMRLKCIMRPALAGISAGHNNILPGEPERPDLWGVRVTDSWFDCSRSLRLRRAFDSTWPRQIVMDKRIPFYSCHFRPGRQCLSYLAISLN